MYGQPQYGQPQMGFGQQPGFQQPGFQQPGFTPGFQPGFQQPPPQQFGYHPPPQQGPTVIHINSDGDDGTPCQFCGSRTSHITRRKVGCVAIAWGFCLLVTGVCWWLPCCMDGCKDVELVCVKCQSVKGVIPANCC